MKKNYEEKAIGLLRTNTAIPSTIAKEIEGIFSGSFAVNANDCFLTSIDFSKMENCSADEIFTAIKKLNKYISKEIKDERYHCHLQGIVIVEKEQKVILCYSGKVILCDVSQATGYLNSFANVIKSKYHKLHNAKKLNFFYSSCDLLKLIEITAFISDGKADAYCEFEKIAYTPKREINKWWENDYR